MKNEWLRLFTICILIVGVVMVTWKNMRVNGEISHLRFENIKLQNQVGFLEVENFNLRTKQIVATEEEIAALKDAIKLLEELREEQQDET